MIFIGVDPGLSGAVAAIRSRGESAVDFLGVWDAPVMEVATGKTKSGGVKKKHKYVPAAMLSILRGILETRADGEGVQAIIERAQAMTKPGENKQGVTSMVSIGFGYGLWIMALTALEIPHTEVAAVTWKLAMVGRASLGDKSRSILRAQELIPPAAGFLKRKKDDGRAESLLIAEWGRRNTLPKGAVVQTWTSPPVVNRQQSLAEAFGEF